MDGGVRKLQILSLIVSLECYLTWLRYATATRGKYILSACIVELDFSWGKSNLLNKIVATFRVSEATKGCGPLRSNLKKLGVGIEITSTKP